MRCMDFFLVMDTPYYLNMLIQQLFFNIMGELASGGVSRGQWAGVGGRGGGICHQQGYPSQLIWQYNFEL